MLEILTDKLLDRYHLTQLKQLSDKIQFWKKKYNSLTEKCIEFEADFSSRKNDLRKKPYAKPNIVTRKVGTQAPIKVN